MPGQDLHLRLPGPRDTRAASRCRVHLPGRLRLRRGRGRLPVPHRAGRGLTRGRAMFRHLVPLCLSTTLLLAGCMTQPKDLDLALTRPTTHERFVVALRPLVQPVPVNRLHAWEVSVTTRAGAPVPNAQIEVDGGMPEHGHGLPTQPRVTKELGDGRYLIEGMKFSMTGWWELKLRVQASSGEVDTVTFNQVIGPPGAAPSSLGMRSDPSSRLP